MTVAPTVALAPASLAPSAAGTSWDVQLAPGDSTSLSSLMPTIAASGATIGATPVPGLYVVRGDAATMAELGPELAAAPGVAAATPERTVQLATVPNDPSYTSGKQWQFNGTYGINAPAAWSLTVGSNSVVVADVDSGLNYNLADMYTNVWLNQAEISSGVAKKLTDVNGDGLITFSDLNNSVNQGSGMIVNTNPGTDGVITGADVLASAANGGWAASPGTTQDGAVAYPNDFIGWNFVNNTNNPSDPNGHGTFTATEIGAVGNNGVGVTGVAWTTQVMPVSFLDATGNGSDAAAASAIHYAVDHGARVINASWGSTGLDPTISLAISYANDHGVIVVCAAGNYGKDDDATFFAPASYSTMYPNMISVAAIDSGGALASWSNYGRNTVQLAAPGVNIYALKSDGTYGTMSGTSMAAPLVTGAVALVEAAHPSWSMTQVIDAILDHTTPDAQLAGKVTTGGTLNVGAAVANAVGPRVTALSAGDTIAAASGLDRFTVTFNEEVDPATFTAAQVALTRPDGTAVGATSVSPVSGSNDHRFLITFPGQFAPGAYSVTIAPSVRDWYGNALNQSGGGNGSAPYTASIPQVPGLSISGLASSTMPGVQQSFSVSAVIGGVVDSHYTGTVHFTSSDRLASLPSNYTFTSADGGAHTFTAKFGTSGSQTISLADTAMAAIAGSASLTVSGGQSPTNSAAYLGQDTATQGSWIGAYGAQGYDLVGQAPSLPSYAAVSMTGAQAHTWASGTTSAPATQVAGGSSRMAACWFSFSSFSIDLNLTDGQQHDLALYLLDWDSTSRVEQVQISDATTGAVLSTQTASSFHSGVYLNFAVGGHVVITITRQGGNNAVLSGLFLDPYSTSSQSVGSAIGAPADPTSAGSFATPASALGALTATGLDADGPLAPIIGGPIPLGDTAMRLRRRA